tara:strand:+ start:222 stop:872 length:651 start_codon:yes stop_codon:yes gene_type:complete
LRYKKYFRKALLKDRNLGIAFLEEVATKKPKFFLEVGVFQGVTARNVCELLHHVNGENFTYIGIDVFSLDNKDTYEGWKNGTNEIIPGTEQNNLLKKFYFKYILKKEPYSLEAVAHLLKKFKKNIHLIKNNSNEALKKIDMSKVDYVFLDGGHSYNTVKNDLNYSKPVLENNGTILCDDYSLHFAPGVKKAIDEFVLNNKLKFEFLLNRFAKIEKK